MYGHDVAREALVVWRLWKGSKINQIRECMDHVMSITLLLDMN
jgi:hypothetical protein